MATEDVFTFTGTCEDVYLPSCPVGTTHIDPCDCRKFYQCDEILNTRVFHNSCSSNTTAWNHVTGGCDFLINLVTNGLCNPTAPWMRCNVTEERELILRQRCTGSSVVTSTSTTPATTSTAGSSTEAPSGGVDAGIVVGAVIGGAVLALIIVAVIVITLRRRKARSPKRTPTQMNPEYFEGNVDDPYAVIDDTLNSPVYNQGDNYIEPNPRIPARTLTSNLDNGPGTGSKINGSLDGHTLAETLHSSPPEVEYDNPGSKREPEKLEDGYSDINKNGPTDNPYLDFSEDGQGQMSNTHEKQENERNSYNMDMNQRSSDISAHDVNDPDVSNSTEDPVQTSDTENGESCSL